MCESINVVTPVLYRQPCGHLLTIQSKPLCSAGWVATLELPAWPDLQGVHPPMGKGDKWHLEVGESHSGEGKIISSHMLVCSILWHSLSHFTACI